MRIVYIKEINKSVSKNIALKNKFNAIINKCLFTFYYFF